MTKCAKCNCAVDFNVLNLCSALGPNVVECHWCGAEVSTGRGEWWQFGSPHKTWYYTVSVIYVITAIFGGGLCTTVGLHFMNNAGNWKKDWGLDEPAFWIGGLVYGTVVALIQYYRVQLSLRRSIEQEGEPLKQSLWSLQIVGQIKFMVLMMVFPAVCWAIGYLGR